MKGIAAPNPLRRRGLPGDALAAVALAACDGGSNAGSPGVASAGSPARRIVVAEQLGVARLSGFLPAHAGRSGSRTSPTPTPMAAQAAVAASTSAGAGSS